MITDNDGKPGLRIESASGITARDMITKHLHTFAHVIKADRAASQSVASAYIDGLAGVLALTISGGLGSKSEVIVTACDKLREAVERDLKHLRRT